MSRQCGLKNIHVALLLTDVEGVATTYALPVKLEKAIKATLKPKSTQTKLYSEDSVEEVVDFFDSIDVSIEVNQFSLASRALLQGAKVVKGVLVESKQDVPPVLAFGFQSKKTNGKSRFIWLYKGSFALSDDTFASEADKFADQTATLTAVFYSRDFDGAYRLIADEDEPLIDPTFITGFYTAVPNQPTAV
ncbi:MAG TPA: major tail protein [Clostridium sp.]